MSNDLPFISLVSADSANKAAARREALLDAGFYTVEASELLRKGEEAAALARLAHVIITDAAPVACLRSRIESVATADSSPRRRLAETRACQALANAGDFYAALAGTAKSPTLKGLC